MTIKKAKEEYEAAVEDLKECHRRLEEYPEAKDADFEYFLERENRLHDLAMARTRLWDAREALKAAEEMQRESLRPKRKESSDPYEQRTITIAPRVLRVIDGSEEAK